MHDQATGLRHWARQQQAPVVDRTLMLFGSAQATVQAHKTLERWHCQGHRWVGDPARWRVQAVDNYHRDLPERWSVWVDSDLGAFCRTFSALSLLREQGGPAQVLALHTGFSQQGLLNNLREAAQRYLGMRLLVIDETRKS
ncbi:hypothetical protein P3S72_25335 [Pseudomonas sp. D3]|jgi:hypothetical protein|uniref:hypothetical protein n=1 Tax=Pseudomonas sp. D3 TaxID=517398 RepID=UPI0023E358F1|nr:hypothetical protein [Pseudomonas sp. D3]WET09768.1 hypothetical protein P3S72_25335 [Pseudomonas sp. D3]